MRGSVPGHWSQDVSKMVPKPQISFHLGDPYGETAGKTQIMIIDPSTGMS